MKSSTMLAATAVVLLASACGGGGANGESGVLWFFSDVPGAVATGLSFEIQIPERFVRQRNQLFPQPAEVFEYDFEGTTLEVAAPPEVDVLATTRGPRGEWIIQLRCGDESVSGSLGVRVLDGARERYADSHLIHCVEPAGWAATFPPRVLPGARFELKFTPRFNDAPLYGRGITIAGADPIAMPASGATLTADLASTFVARRPGSGLTLVLGRHTDLLSLEVLDLADWNVSVEAKKVYVEALHTDAVHVRAAAVDLEGQDVVAPDCALTVTPEVESLRVNGPCDRVLPADWAGEACATMSGRTTCTSFL